MDETGKVDIHRVEELVDHINRLPEDMSFGDWLRIMPQLQEVAFGAYYDQMDPFERADLMRMNLFAAVSEIVELGQEMGWKPWASNQGSVDRQRVIGEAVDLLHFVGNLLKLANATGAELTAAYKAKMRTNLQRQIDGYDGRADKCAYCMRELTVDLASDELHTWRDADGHKFCNQDHYSKYYDLVT